MPRGITRSIHLGRPLVERVVAPTSLALPVEKGQRVGRVEVYDGNRLVAASTLVTAEDVADAGLWAKAKWYMTHTLGNAWEIVT